MKRAGALSAALLALVLTPAHAHRPSDAFVTLNVDGARVHGQWEIALRDLEAGVGVDANRDGSISWGELQAARGRIETMVEQTLALETRGRPCQLRVSDVLVNERIEGRFAFIALDGNCPEAPAVLTLRYRFLADVDPTHRGFLVLKSAGAAYSAILGPENAVAEIRLGEASAWREVRDYVGEGIHHIWIGADHILFLLSLLLPCVLVFDGPTRRGASKLRPVLGEVAIVVTAFTIAHSITLALAAFDVLRLPSKLTESAIALSVIFAALNNVWPVVTHGRWGAAFGFGLVHGFGFASVLGELGLPQDARLLALVSFNVGVELGQLAIVALALPAAFALRDTVLYRRGVLTAGSLLIAVIATHWFAQRSGLLQLFQ